MGDMEDVDEDEGIATYLRVHRTTMPDHERGDRIRSVTSVTNEGTSQGTAALETPSEGRFLG